MLIFSRSKDRSLRQLLHDQDKGFIHPLNVDHHGNKLQKTSSADYGETSLWIANKRTI
jgi:hypothetical protein